MAEEVLVRNPENEALTWTEGAYMCVRVAGKYNVGLNDALREKVFASDDNSIALDSANLTGMPISFARELYFQAQNRKKGETRLVLVNPPDYLRSLFKLVNENHDIPMVPDFKQLPRDPMKLERHLKDLQKSLMEIREKLQRNPLWQFLDRDSCWVCPYCATPLTEVKIVSKINIPGTAVEKIHTHVSVKCPQYDPNRPSMVSREEMVSVVQKINNEKFAASADHARDLQSQVSALEKKGRWADEMEKGLKIAVERQKHLLPDKAPEIPGVEISLVYRPAAEVSGDFYDFVEFEDGRLAIIVGDVSGHGIEAAILMGMTKKVLQIRVSEMENLREAVVQANADICRDMDKKSFVTGFISILDPKHKTLTYVRAGHNPPVVVNRARNPQVVQLECGGTILGMNAGPLFDRATEMEQVQLQQGDHFILYTDGIEEAKNPADQMYGRERIIEVTQREFGKELGFILGALSYDLDNFADGVPLEDDVTIIGVRIT